MENTEQYLHYLKEIETWEQDQKGLWFWEKLGRIPFKVLDKLTPAFIQEKMGVLISELASFVQTGGQYLVSRTNTLKMIQKNTLYPVTTLEDIQHMPLGDMVALSEKLRKSRKTFATVQGASTGIGGIFTLAIDIPVILGVALKTLQEIAIIHGYDPNDKVERVFIVKCLQFASADIIGKEAILKELAEMEKASSQEMMSQLKGWQEVFFTYRDHFGMKKMFQMIPIAGMIFGAYANRTLIQDIAEVGTMLYRKRRVLERLKLD